MTWGQVDGPAVALSPELVDLVTEAVVRPAGAAARGEVIATVLVGMLDAITWRGGDPAEAASLLQVVRAASEHRDRMASAADRRGSESAVVGLDRLGLPAPVVQPTGATVAVTAR